jgi:hypothetical protein
MARVNGKFGFQIQKMISGYSLESVLLESSRVIEGEKIAAVSSAIAGRPSCKLG